MIDPADTSGVAFAAVALSTASLAAAVRRGEISVSEMRAIIADAHALVHDQAGFVSFSLIEECSATASASLVIVACAYI